MLCHFVLMVVLFVLNFKYLIKEFKKINKKVLLILLIIFLFGSYLRNSEYWLGTHTDGYVAQESAKMWILHGEHFKSCGLGNQIECEIPEQVLAPPGFPLLIVIAHLIFGLNSLNASVISAVLSSLIIILVFLNSWLLFKNEKIGLISAFIFSVIPINIINSQTGLSRPVGLFFVSICVLFYLLALKHKKYSLWFAVVVFLSYAIYVRQESYALLPVFLLFFVIFNWRKIKNFKEIYLEYYLKFIEISLIFFILQLHVLRWLLFNNPYNSYGHGGFFALHYSGILIQGKALFLQLFNNWGDFYHYNFIFSFFFLFGFFILLVKFKKNNFFILSIFGIYFLVYSLMFDGGMALGKYVLTGDYMRRSIMFDLSYSIVSGYGLFFIFSLFLKGKNFLSNIFIFFILLHLLFLFQFIFNTDINNLKLIYLPNSLFKDSRADKEGDKTLIHPNNEYWNIIKNTPNNCMVVSSQYLLVTSDYFKNNNRKTAQIDLINHQTQDKYLKVFKESKCIIYISDYRCRHSDDFGCLFIDRYFENEPLYKINDLTVNMVKIKD